MTFRQWFEREQQRNKLTQAQLAERTGVSQGEISRLLSGDRTNPTFAVRQAIWFASGKKVKLDSWPARGEAA